MIQTLMLNLLRPLATVASGVGKRKKLLIMIYHRVLDEPDYMRPSEVDKEAFTWQMQLLAKHFNVLPLAVALERLQNDTLPPRAVCITFDDGYADNYTNALPILQRFKLTATFFIASGFLDGGRMWNDTVIEAVRRMGGAVLDLNEEGLGVFATDSEIKKCQAAQQLIQKIKYLDFSERAECVEAIAAKSKDLPSNLMMTSEQLKELHRNGMDVGGHTRNHPILAKLKDEKVREEIGENKLFLEDLLEEKLNIFAYPNGKPEMDYLPHHAEIVKELGFKAALATQWGVVSKTNNYLELPRFTPWDKQPVKFMMRVLKIFVGL